MLAARAATAPRLGVSLVRGFSSTSAVAKPRTQKWEKPPPFMNNDVSSLTHLRMMGIEESRILISRSVLDAEELAAQAKKYPYKPPKGTIRVISQVELANPDSPYAVKRVLIAPVSALPLSTPEAIQRLKVLAGPRWTPGQPGRGELGPNASAKLAEQFEQEKHGKEGYLKISEERYPEARMNRKSVSDILERLVAAANDPNSPIPADTPVDTRHLLARQDKLKARGQNMYARRLALDARKEVVGGVRGFPVEWLSEEALSKLPAKQRKA